MSVESLLKIRRDSLGTAEGTCLVCGAFLSVHLPTEQPATEALSKIFDRHVKEKHGDVPGVR
jgi:hypothetical protein